MFDIRDRSSRRSQSCRLPFFAGLGQPRPNLGNRLLNLAVSLMGHRANRASTLYCQSEAKSHAGILGNVANAGMLPMSNPNVSGIAAKMAAFQVRRNHNGQDAPLSNGTECGTMSPFPEGEKEMRTMSKTIERPRLDEDVVPFTEYRQLRGIVRTIARELSRDDAQRCTRWN